MIFILLSMFVNQIVYGLKNKNIYLGDTIEILDINTHKVRIIL